MIVLLIPPPATVTVPVLAALPVFSSAISASTPLPVPLVSPDITTVNHDSSFLVAVQVVFDVTIIAVYPKDAPRSHVVGVTSSDGGGATGADWVTAIVLVMPLPVTVIVPVLAAVPVFAVAFRVNVPLPVPLEGETVSQAVALLVAVQDTFDDTVAVVLPAVDAGFHAPGETVREGGATVEDAWVTVTVLVTPTPETVMVPVLALAPLFSYTSTASAPSPVPVVP